MDHLRSAFMGLVLEPLVTAMAVDVMAAAHELLESVFENRDKVGGKVQALFPQSWFVFFALIFLCVIDLHS